MKSWQRVTLTDRPGDGRSDGKPYRSKGGRVRYGSGVRNLRQYWEPALVSAFFFGVGSIILAQVVFEPGAIAGGDWSTPVTRLQLETYSRNGLFLWTHVQNVFGVAQPFVVTLISGLFFGASRILDGPQIDRFVLLSLYTFAGASVFAYARFLGLHRVSALAAGSMYVATPVFFNYTAMGWGFVLLAFSFIPWVLILFGRSVEGGAYLPTLTLAALFTIGFSFASQSLVWYPLAMMALAAFKVRSRMEFWWAVRAFALCALVFLVLNLHWVLPLVRYGDPLLSSTASQSDVPLGQRLSVLNILRGWGSLFNWPYETAYPNSLLAFSLIPPLVGYAALFLWPRDWRPRFLITLALVPLVFYVLPSTFYDLPFTAVIRDVSRFILFQALACSLLVALSLDWVLTRPVALGDGWRKYGQRVLAVAFAVPLFVSAYPVWAGELTGTSKQNYDIRLRTVSLPQDYDMIEQKLALEGGSAKSLYFPTGMFLNLPADNRFNGPFREFNDAYAAYAPRPGGIFEGDRRAGEYRTIASFINGREFLSAANPPAETLGALGIRWIVVRRDLEGHTYKTPALVRHFDTDAALIKRHDSDIVLYENTSALPVVYASTAPVFHEASIRTGLQNAFPTGFTERRQVAFFPGSAFRADDKKLLHAIGGVGVQNPVITFQRVNPTRFDIRVENPGAPFFLVLSETFDPRWRLQPMDETLRLPSAKQGDGSGSAGGAAFVWSDASLTDRPSLPESAHFIANGYANAWYIEPGSGNTALAFRAVFAPQLLAYVGFGVASIGLLLLTGTITFMTVQRRLAAVTTPRSNPDSPRSPTPTAMDQRP